MFVCVCMRVCIRAAARTHTSPHSVFKTPREKGEKRKDKDLFDTRMHAHPSYIFMDHKRKQRCNFFLVKVSAILTFQVKCANQIHRDLSALIYTRMGLFFYRCQQILRGRDKGAKEQGLMFLQTAAICREPMNMYVAGESRITRVLQSSPKGEIRDQVHGTSLGWCEAGSYNGSGP